MRTLVPALAAALLAAILTLPAAHATEAGQPAPAFALPTAKGDTVALDKLRGKVVYVDFWASWCGPCRRSFPWMNEMQQKYGAKGFTVVAVNVDKKRADAEKFLGQNPANFTVVYDEAGSTPAAYGVKGMPPEQVEKETGMTYAAIRHAKMRVLQDLQGVVKRLRAEEG